MRVRSPEEIVTYLAALEETARAQVLNLGEARKRVEDMVYVAFVVCGEQLLTLLPDLKEIMYVPGAITHVPGVQPWMRGIANIRGSLLPVVDLQMFLCGTEQSVTAQSRVLVIDRGGIVVGLQVPVVHGLRHVSADAWRPVPETNDRLRDFLDGAHTVDDEIWPVFNTDALVQNPRFRVASI